MVAAIAQWRSIGGLRWTDPNETAELALQALTDLNPAGENGIDRVEFYVSVNGGAPTTTTVTSLQVCRPNHSRGRSYLPGVDQAALAPFPGYRLRLKLGSLAGGTITVTATVFSRAGTATPLDRPIVLYNDSDGVDRRPCTATIYVHPNGNDANPGTALSPKRTGMAGLLALRPNPSGSGSADCDLRGGRVVFQASPTPHKWIGGFYGTPWHTSGYGWVELLAEDGATFERTIAGGSINQADSVFPDCLLVATGFGSGSACRIKLTNIHFRGAGGSITNGNDGVTREVWADGCTRSSHHYDAIAKPWTVRFNEDEHYFYDWNNASLAISTPSRMYATRCAVIGAVNGFNNFFHLHDCLVSNYTQVAFYTFNNNSTCNCIAQKHRSYRDVAGRVHGNVPNAICSVPAPGQLRIDATSNLVFGQVGFFEPMFLQTLTELIGITSYRVSVTGSGWPAGNTGVFPVLAAGTNGNGFGYVVLACPTATAGTAAATNSNIETCYPNGNSDLWHADIVWTARWGPTTHTDSFHYGLTARDTDGGQLWFQSDTPMERVAYWNCRDGNNYELIHNFGTTAQRRHCIWLHCSIGGFWNWNSGADSTGLNFVNNVIQNTGSSTIPGSYVQNNHFVTGAVSGSNATSGAWFAGNHQASPWVFQPLASRFDTGNTMLPTPEEWRWIGSLGTTRGCYRDTGMVNWGINLPPPDDVFAEVELQLPSTLSADAQVGLAGDLQMLLPLEFEAEATVGVAGDLAMTLPLQLDVEAQIGLLGELQAVLPLTFVGDLVVESLGELEMALPLQLDFDAQVGLAGELEMLLPSTLEAEATSTDIGATAEVEMVLPLTLDGEVLVDATGELTMVLPVTFEADTLVHAVAEMDMRLPLTFAAEAPVGIAATLQMVLPLTVRGEVDAPPPVVYFPPPRPPGGLLRRWWPFFRSFWR